MVDRSECILFIIVTQPKKLTSIKLLKKPGLGELGTFYIFSHISKKKYVLFRRFSSALFLLGRCSSYVNFLKKIKIILIKKKYYLDTFANLYILHKVYNKPSKGFLIKQNILRTENLIFITNLFLLS